MRFKTKNSPNAQIGDTRIRKRFLFFPEFVNYVEYTEWRWLETARVREKYVQGMERPFWDTEAFL